MAESTTKPATEPVMTREEALAIVGGDHAGAESQMTHAEEGINLNKDLAYRGLLDGQIKQETQALDSQLKAGIEGKLAEEVVIGKDGTATFKDPTFKEAIDTLGGEGAADKYLASLKGAKPKELGGKLDKMAADLTKDVDNMKVAGDAKGPAIDEKADPKKAAVDMDALQKVGGEAAVKAEEIIATEEKFLQTKGLSKEQIAAANKVIRAATEQERTALNIGVIEEGKKNNGKMSDDFTKALERLSNDPQVLKIAAKTAAGHPSPHDLQVLANETMRGASTFIKEVPTFEAPANNSGVKAATPDGKAK